MGCSNIVIFVVFSAAFKSITGEYGDRIKNATITWGENLQMQESRHSYAISPYPPPNPHTELPITFQAPYINARDYWNDPARRTDYNPYSLPRPITSGINSLYNLMQQFFGGEESPQPSPYRPGFDPPPYKQESPYANRPYYIPGPKPIRASIQKLEPPRQHFPAFQSSLPPENHYPQFVKILNEVLNEKPEPVLEKPDYIYQYIVPTTYKPRRQKVRPTPPVAFPVSIQDQLPPAHQGQDTRIPYVIDTTSSKVPVTRPVVFVTETTSPKQPVVSTSVVFPPETETVPPLDYAIDVRNALPAVTRRSLSSVTLPTTTPEVLLANIVRSVEASTLTTNIDVTTNGESVVQATTIVTEKVKKRPVLEEIRASTVVPPTATPITEELQEPTTDSNLLLPETTTETIPFQTQQSELQPISVVTELLNTIEPMEFSRFRGPFPKKLHSRKVTTDPSKATTDATSVDYVTDLTVKGLTDTTAVYASVPRYLNRPNVSSVIGYALRQVNGTAPPFDEWSLDAKILEDTNWDGYQPPIPSTTSRDFSETTTSYPSTLASTEVPTTTQQAITEQDLPTTVPSTTSERILSTTGNPTTLMVPPTTELPSSTEREETVVATRMSISVSKTAGKLRVPLEEMPSPRNQEPDEEQTTEPPTTTSTTTTTVATTRRARKYQRRKKVTSFTPRSLETSSTESPVKFGTISRPFYQKRSRPNATLTFKKPTSRRNEVSSSEKPVVVRSEEEIQKRRNLYRRREYPGQLRRSTTAKADTEEET